MSSPLSIAVSTHNAIKEKLKAEYGLDDDDEFLKGTLEGESDLKELIIRLVRQSRYEAAQSEAIKGLIEDMRERKARREEKAQKLRDIVAWAMDAAGEKYIDGADVTVSLRMGKPKLVTNGEPDELTKAEYVKLKITRSWDKDALAIGLDQFDGEALAVAHWDNGSNVLTVRGK
jgi:hypothetical protein